MQPERPYFPSSSDAQIFRWSPVLVLLLSSCCLIVSGCGSTSPETPESEAKEILAPQQAGLASGEQELFRNAKRYYAFGVYNLAQENFEALRTNFPVSPYAEFADIKLADSFFEIKKFDTAAVTYEQFIKERPAAAAAPYALMRTARSYQLAYGGLGRDTAPLEKALTYYDKTIEQYPLTVYGKAAVAHREEVLRGLKSHEELIASYYERKEATLASQERRRVAEEQWSPMVIAASAATEQAQTVAMSERTITGSSSDRSVIPVGALVPTVYALRRNGVDATAPDANVQRAGLTRSDAALQIERIECLDDGGRRAIVYLSQPLEDASSVTVSADSSSRTKLTLPSAGAVGGAQDCFGSGDLTVTNDGVITIAGVTRVSLMSIRTPARLVVAVEE